MDDLSGKFERISDANVDLASATERTTFSFSKYGSVLTGIGRLGTSALHMYTAWNVQQIRLANAQDRVTEAQGKYNDALASGDTKRAVDALKALTAAQEAQKQAIIESDIAMVAFGLHAVGMVGKALKLVPKIGQLLGRGQGGGTSGALSTVAGAGVLCGLGSKIKSFAGSKAGQVILPLTAAAATYGFLTETEEGRAINEYNPIRLIADAIFRASHTPQEVALAEAQRAAAMGGGAGSQTQVTNYYQGYSASELQAQNMSDEQYFGQYTGP